MANIQSLPTPIFQTLVDCLDLTTKALLALCSKALLTATGGHDVFRSMSQDRDALSKFLLQLEKDISPPPLFCPTCVKIHLHTSAYVGGSENEKKDNMRPCFKKDTAFESAIFYGESMYYLEARLLMQLHRWQHPEGPRFLRDHEEVMRVGKLVLPTMPAIGSLLPQSLQKSWPVIYQFLRRNLKIINVSAEQSPQLFLRLEHWCVISDQVVMSEEAAEFTQLRRTPYQATICRHVKDSLKPISDSNPSPYNIGLAMVKKARKNLTDSKDQHSHVEIRQCRQCGVDYRIDIVSIPDALRLPYVSALHRRSLNWAIVVTKWMNLGTLDTQHSEFQLHLVDPDQHKLDLTSPRLARGDTALLFETEQTTGTGASLQYKPLWSRELEEQIKAVWHE